MDYKAKYQQWCTDPYFDEATKAELAAIAGNETEIQERFYKDLEFGTGGLRGILGAGTNRMNVYTVRRATQGLANYIKKQGLSRRGVVIAHDCRRMSPEFCREAALCLAANGIKAYVFESLRPTPELSFALRELGCVAGIVVTASHNPPEYNGYKVYWEDGAQITSPKDKEIIEEVNSITDFASCKTMLKDEAEINELYHVIGSEMDRKYIDALERQIIHPEVIQEMGKTMKIVYTPLHGTGNVPARRVLKEIGFKNVYEVKEQAQPDGNFPTVSYPNPEDPKAFALALKLAKEVDADLVLATDPDADRLGVYAKDSATGEYMSFTGNMSGSLVCEYVLSQRKELGTLPRNGAVVETIVSTDMVKAIARNYNMKLIEVLTGFKYIGEQIKLFEQQNTYSYQFGFEESYGLLVGTHARDKDAIVAVMLLCEAAAFYKKQGLTLWDQMQNIYKKYGYYREGLQSVTLKGMDGIAQMDAIMESLRNNPIKELEGYSVLEFRDYLKDESTNLISGVKTSTGLPKSNVLYYQFDDNAWCCVRPSGTEPKIKFYIGVKGTDYENAGEKLAALTKGFLKLAGQDV